MTGAGSYTDMLLRNYRYLRAGMAVVLFLLAVSVIVEIIDSGLVLGSLSAYYYTPVHSIFIGTLCTVGACLVAYRATDDLEDAVLNISGFLAFVVAFVPTRGAPAVSDETVVANVYALLAVGVVALGVAFATAYTSRNARVAEDARASVRNARVLLGLSTAGLAALAVFFLGWRTAFLKVGHGIAALGLFAGIVFVVWLHAYRKAAGKGSAGWRRWLNEHTAIFAGMLSALVVFGLLWLTDAFDQAIFWLEISVIVLFGLFWLLETVRLWNEPLPQDGRS